MVSTPSKNISQNGNLPQIGVKIKNIWVATTQMSTKKIARVHKNWSQPEPTWSTSMRISAECIWWIDFFALRAGYPFLVANLKGYSVIHHSYLHEMFRLIKKHLCFLSGSTWVVKFGWATGCKTLPCELEDKLVDLIPFFTHYVFLLIE